MTKTEAIRILYEYKAVIGAVNTKLIDAIEALSATDTNVGTNDTISRQAAIDAINKIMPTREGFYEPSEVLCELMQLPSAQPEHWIPVTERLPKNDEKVLVTVKNGEVLFGNYHGKHWAYGSKVVAWMPLPEPYVERRTNGVQNE